MPYRNWVIALLFGGMLASLAQGQVKLEWRFKEGEKFSLEVVMDSKEVSAEKGKPEKKTNLRLIFDLEYRVDKRLSDNTVDITQTIRSLKAEGTGDLTELNDICRRFAGTQINITLDGKLRLKRFEGYNAAIERIGNRDPALMMYLAELFPADNLKTIVRETFAPLPDRPIAVNAKWGGGFIIPLGDFGKLEGTTDYTYAGTVDGREKFIVEARATNYTAPRSGYVAPVKNEPVKVENVKGTIYFDKALGKLSESEVSMTIKGAFRVAGPMNKETTVDMSQDRSIKLKMVKGSSK